jgi:hypothetical protein
MSSFLYRVQCMGPRCRSSSTMVSRTPPGNQLIPTDVVFDMAFSLWQWQQIFNLSLSGHLVQMRLKGRPWNAEICRKNNYVISNSFIFANANSESDPVFPKVLDPDPDADSGLVADYWNSYTETQNATFSINNFWHSLSLEHLKLFWTDDK